MIPATKLDLMSTRPSARQHQTDICLNAHLEAAFFTVVSRGASLIITGNRYDETKLESTESIKRRLQADIDAAIVAGYLYPLDYTLAFSRSRYALTLTIQFDYLGTTGRPVERKESRSALSWAVPEAYRHVNYIRMLAWRYNRCVIAQGGRQLAERFKVLIDGGY